MKPAYRPSPRIYRGQRRVAGPGRCPVCDRLVSINASGQRRSHRDTHGFQCPGSGVQVVEAPARAYDVEAALEAQRELEQRIAAEQELARQRARLEAEPWRPAAEPAPGRCPECGQNPRANSDGTLRAHRAQPDTFAGPYCPGGRPKGRQ